MYHHGSCVTQLGTLYHGVYYLTVVHNTRVIATMVLHLVEP